MFLLMAGAVCLTVNQPSSVERGREKPRRGLRNRLAAAATASAAGAAVRAEIGHGPAGGLIRGAGSCDYRNNRHLSFYVG